MRNPLSLSLCVGTTACLLAWATGCQTKSCCVAQPAPAAPPTAVSIPAEPAAPAPSATPAAPVMTSPAVPAAPTAAVPAARQVVVRIKAGSDSPFTDSSGNVWQAEKGFEGGETTGHAAAVANTKDPGLFLSEHYSMESVSLNVAPGKYLAKLYFAETYEGITGPGQRVFSFNVQGHEFKDFDVWVKAGGPNRAYVETVPVEVKDGKFKITFASNIENPQINALELIPQP